MDATALLADLEKDYVMFDTQDNEPYPADTDYLSIISDSVDSISKDVRAISIDIHDHPELQYKEYHAHEVLTGFLKQREGWEVTPSAYGIDTAFVAVWRSGSAGPTVSFNAVSCS
jgi:hypothetical protein